MTLANVEAFINSYDQDPEKVWEELLLSTDAQLIQLIPSRVVFERLVEYFAQNKLMDSAAASVINEIIDRIGSHIADSYSFYFEFERLTILSPFTAVTLCKRAPIKIAKLFNTCQEVMSLCEKGGEEVVGVLFDDRQSIEKLAELSYSDQTGALLRDLNVVHAEKLINFLKNQASLQPIYPESQSYGLIPSDENWILPMPPKTSVDHVKEVLNSDQDQTGNNLFWEEYDSASDDDYGMSEDCQSGNSDDGGSSLDDPDGEIQDVSLPERPTPSYDESDNYSNRVVIDDGWEYYPPVTPTRYPPSFVPPASPTPTGTAASYSYKGAENDWGANTYGMLGSGYGYNLPNTYLTPQASNQQPPFAPPPDERCSNPVVPTPKPAKPAEEASKSLQARASSINSIFTLDVLTALSKFAIAGGVVAILIGVSLPKLWVIGAGITLIALGNCGFFSGGAQSNKQSAVPNQPYLKLI